MQKSKVIILLFKERLLSTYSSLDLKNIGAKTVGNIGSGAF